MLFNKPYIIYTALVMSAAALSACATTQAASSSDTASFGKAIHANMAAQIVAPTPEQKMDTYIPVNRTRRDLALEAYETDTIPPLPESVTSDVNE